MLPFERIRPPRLALFATVGPPGLGIGQVPGLEHILKLDIVAESPVLSAASSGSNSTNAGTGGPGSEGAFWPRF